MVSTTFATASASLLLALSTAVQGAILPPHVTPTPTRQLAARDTSRASNDYQTYNQGLGGIYAPAVTQSAASNGMNWWSGGYQYWTIDLALQGSCNIQQVNCNNARAQWWIYWFSQADCQNQSNDCNSVGTSAASAYSASSVAASSSAAASSRSASAAAASSLSASASVASSLVASASAAASRATSASVASSLAASASAAASLAASASAASSLAASASAASSLAASASVAASVAASASAASSRAAAASAAASLAASASAASSLAASASVASSLAASASAASSLAASASAAASVAASASAASSRAASASAASSLAASASLAQSILASASAAASAASAAAAANASSLAASVSVASSLAASASVASSLSASISAAAASASAANASSLAASASAASSLLASASVASSLSASISAAAASASSLAASASAASSLLASASAASSLLASASLASSLSASASAASSLLASASVASSLSASASAAAASASAAAAAAIAIPSGWNAASTACISEGSAGRALVGASFTDPAMTYKKCTDYCTSKGFVLAGVEYSSECYCGASLVNGGTLKRSSSNCNMPCSGASGAICGGSNAITLLVSDQALSDNTLTSDYTSTVVNLPAGWSAGSSTCVLEGTTGRALAGASLVASDMTIATCLAFCTTKGMQWAGVEYSTECYCGNDLVNGASLSRTAECSMPCGGALGTICGGPNRLSLYQNPSLAYALVQVGQWSKVGCIQEVAGRALTGASVTADSSMTLDKCTTYCYGLGFAIAGVEYGSECYCGNTLDNNATLSAYSTQCNMACSGNRRQTCGGPNAIAMYSTLTPSQLVGA